MTFVYPLFLWALLLASIPIIIYYLMRFRSLKVPWGANYVLERALERLRKKLYLDQLILIALRVLAILALVFAFARPLAKGKNEVSGTGVHRILVVDASYSMLANDGDKSAWDRAKNTMRELVATWSRGERWSLAMVTDELDWVVSDQSIDSTEECFDIIAGLETREASASLAPALENILTQTGGRPTEIYIFADDQATTWANVERVALPEGGAVKLYWVNASPEKRPNVGVTQVNVSHERALPEHPVRAFARVRNFSQEPVKDIEVSFLVDGRHAGKERVSLLPGQETWAHADVMFEDTGSHYVTARLPQDILEFDNSMSAGITVSPTLTVRVIKDAQRDQKFDSAHSFLNLMADVAQRTDDGGPPAFTVLPPCTSDCTYEDLSEADVVIVDGGTDLTNALAEKLKRYVDNGGGLLLTADDAVSPQTWHRHLEPAGLMIAKLTAPEDQRLGGDTFRQLSRTGFETPSMRSFESEDMGDIGNTRFYSWFRLEDIVDDASVLATFSDGQPFAVMRRGDPGIVILMVSGLNCRKNNLIVRETGYAWVVRLLMTASAGSVFPRTVERNQPLRLEIEGDEPPTGIQFNLQQGAPSPLTLQTAGQRRVAVLQQGVRRSGLGSVLVIGEKGHGRVWFGIQGDRGDSDLSSMKESVFETIQQNWDLDTASNWEELNALLAASRRGREWYAWAVILVLAAMIGEMAMQRRFV